MEVKVMDKLEQGFKALNISTNIVSLADKEKGEYSIRCIVVTVYQEGTIFVGDETGCIRFTANPPRMNVGETWEMNISIENKNKRKYYSFVNGKRIDISEGPKFAIGKVSAILLKDEKVLVMRNKNSSACIDFKYSIKNWEQHSDLIKKTDLTKWRKEEIEDISSKDHRVIFWEGMKNILCKFGDQCSKYHPDRKLRKCNYLHNGELKYLWNELEKKKPSLIVESQNERWCFPGGSPDHGEKLIKEALRELKEETNIELKESDCIAQVESDYGAPNIKHLFFIFKGSLESCKPKLRGEFEVWEWCDLEKIYKKDGLFELTNQENIKNKIQSVIQEERGEWGKKEL